MVWVSVPLQTQVLETFCWEVVEPLPYGATEGTGPLGTRPGRGYCESTLFCLSPGLLDGTRWDLPLLGVPSLITEPEATGPPDHGLKPPTLLPYTWFLYFLASGGKPAHCDTHHLASAFNSFSISLIPRLLSDVYNCAGNITFNSSRIPLITWDRELGVTG